MNCIPKFEKEFFASEVHNSTARRCRDLWTLIANDPIYSSNRRVIILAGDQGAQTAEKIASVARLIGAAGVAFLPSAKGDNLCKSLDDMGLTPDRWEQCGGGEKAYLAAKEILQNVPLPPELNIVKITPETSYDLVKATAELSVDCGVTPLPGASMRGVDTTGISLAALDQSGAPVSTAGSFRMFHRNSYVKDQAFWGLLATRDDYRGKKLALILGAMTIVHMWENEGARGFFTGIREDNTVSMTVCAKLGITQTDQCFIICTDPVHFGDVVMTR